MIAHNYKNDRFYIANSTKNLVGTKSSLLPVSAFVIVTKKLRCNKVEFINISMETLVTE